MNINFILSLCFLLSVPLCNGYRILAIFPTHGRSHFKVLEQIAKALAEKGHQVDVVSAFQQQHKFPNYTDIVKLNIDRVINPGFYFSEFKSRSDAIKSLHSVCRLFCDGLGNPELMKIIKNPPNDPPYDLVMVHYMCGYQCFTAIGHLWNVPVVGMVTTAMYATTHHFIGNPLNLAIASKNLINHKENMTFWDRLHNFVVTRHLIYEYYAEAYKQEEIIKRYLGSDLPHYTELERSLSLVIANSHYSFHGIQPKTPALIEVAGIHIKNDNSTTVDPKLKKIMDESTEGFVYFSFGSLAVVESFPKETIEKFYAAFRKISPIRIVMRSANPRDLPKNLPDNVYTFPWLPQEKILQHPKIKAFVTHTGGLGTQEAVYYGVPMICVPLFADQFINCDILTNKKIGVKLLVRTAEQSDYHRTFEEILNNPIYKHSAKKFSAVFKDRPLKPKDEVVYWVEYVLRHGKDILRSPAVHLSWWQIDLLDIYCFLIAVTLILVSLIVFVVRKLVAFILSKNKSALSVKYVGLSKKAN